MDYQSLHNKTVVELRKLAKDLGVRVPGGTNKSTLIAMLLESESAATSKQEAPEKRPEAKADKAPKAGKKAADANGPVKRPRGRPRKVRPEEAAPVEKPAEKPVEAQAAHVEKPAEKPVEAQAAHVEKPAEKPVEAQDAPVAEVPVAEEKPIEVPAPVETPAEAKAGSAQEAPADKPVEAKVEPAAQEPAEKPAEVRPEPAAADGGARPVQRAQQGVQFRSNPRPAGDERQRVNMNRQGWSANRQGDARQQRFQPGAQRQGNARFSRPANGQPQENRDPQRRAARGAEITAPAQAEGASNEQERQRRVEGGPVAEVRPSNPAAPEMPAAGEYGEGAGVLEIQPDGYGFLRAENCLPGANDVYISIAQIRRFNLRNGDYVVGKTRAQREGDRFGAIMYITEINGEPPEKTLDRPRFEDLVPIYPDQRLRLEPPGGNGDLSLRLIDMLAPIGKGQRGMIVSQPKAGKTTLLKKVANAITSQYPDVYLIVLLIDERPEEVTDMQRSIKGEVIYSTFDEEPEHHTRVSEMVLARAQRLVEMGKDVVVLLDSITRLARAYNLTITPTGRSLSGGLDPGALFKPKHFFGAARNIENGGSLTIIATALVDTGSRMDDIIFEEFKGTGNMELHLDRKLSDRRVFPAIDLLKSGTRREELLLSEDEINGEYQVRKMLNGRQQEMYEQLIELMSKTASNADFFTRLKGWLSVYEKEGYSLGGR